MLHIIKRQRIELQLPQGEDSFSIQQKLSDQYWEFFVPLMDEILNGLSEENNVLSLESLTIDLGKLKLSDLDGMKSNSQLIENIRQQFEEQIWKEKSTKNVLNFQDKAHANFNKWFSYLREGYLDWNVEFPIDDWYEHVLEALSSNLETLNHFILEVDRSPNFRIRLVRQHPDSFLNRLINVIAPKYENLIEKKATEFYTFESLNKDLASDRLKERREQFWLELLLAVSTDFFNPNQADSKSHIELIKPENYSNSSTVDNPVRSFDEFKDSSDIKEAIFLDYVGLVLLHPFLSSLFKRLDLLQDKDFKNVEAKEKAIHLLHFAATGSDQPKEYELVIPKIFCAYPIKAAIPITMELSNAEREEVNAMLEACIANWEILKKTSIDGLRESFLQRKGKVELGMEKITVQVEKGSVDMLLDYLPWSLNMIKFPWLKQLIHVEWR